MSDSAAQLIWEVLVKYAGANHFLRDTFCCAMIDGVDQFRFAGDLGFGTRLYVSDSCWKIDTYHELRGPARVEAIITATNAALDALRMKLGGVAESPVAEAPEASP